MASVIQVKIAQKRANLPDAQYRELLQRVAGVESCTELDDKGRDQILRAIRTATTGDRKGVPAMSPLLRKLWALFFAIRDSLPRESIAHPTRWLLGVARRVNADDKITSLGNLTRLQLMKTIEALKVRAGQTPGRRGDYHEM